jgi:hypothetical protein
MAKSFDDFYKELQRLVQSYKENDIMIKVEPDLESHIIRIFGEKMSSFGRAKNGLADASELALTTAEHHPYWSLLYHACQIAKITLDKWESDLSKEELDEILWSIDELRNSCEKVMARPHNDHA